MQSASGNSVDADAPLSDRRHPPSAAGAGGPPGILVLSGLLLNQFGARIALVRRWALK